ncbi:hypothetical protein [Trichococcus collinsii]|uniref:EVE domain-containing protein n=1 Tax=Trichococcus collinsii TaxID=157076 RepID=A0AB37ZWQ0_9LACT|nr:hypothetical protein [Trichococcus collinsii]CZQ82306.1 Hypothetical protein Tcol_201 [Trichococcus collinsii]SDZ87636.1 hypothetical protein SAMN04488525_101478 [Trichococcus collinsii]
MLYKLDTVTKDYAKVNRVNLKSLGWKEVDLQKLLSNHIQDLISTNELMTIFNERPRQEEPDILALDKNGDLFIFELKRWSSHEENLLQVLRYGQLYGNSSYDELNDLFNKYLRDKDSNAELYEIHQQYFDLADSSRISKEEYNRKQHFLIVTNGLDQKTVEAIAYWKKNGLNIDAVVYWVFEINNEYFIEFNLYSPVEGLLEYESNTYILNTNYANNEQHTEDMLKEHKAAAYYPGWREKVSKLQKGDTVFLYKSGTGIIAHGIASGKLEKQDCDGHHNYEYYMKLEKFQELKNPLSASEMKRVAKQGFNFRQTMYSISEECTDLLIKEVKDKCL